MSSSDGPICAAAGIMVDFGLGTGWFPPVRNPRRAHAGQTGRFALMLVLRLGKRRVRFEQYASARDGVLRQVHVEFSYDDVQGAAHGFFVASGDVVAD